MILMLKKEKLNIIILSFLFLILSFVTFLKQGVPIVDFGREVYIPSQMVQGEVLFKDIFNIFGPLSYQINALAFKLFGTNISVLNILGLINSYIILIFTYFLSRKFLNDKISFAISLFILTGGIFKIGLFNYNLPYSYATLYALSSVLISVYFFISFFENRNQKLLYLSTFFLGCSIAFKYDYLFFAFFVLIYLILKKVDYKIILKSILSFFIPIIVSFSILFIQGVTLKDLVTHIILISKMVKSPSLIYLYDKFTGMYPSVIRLRNIFIYFFVILATICINYLPFLSSFFINKKLSNYKLLSFVLKSGNFIIFFTISYLFIEIFLLWFNIFRPLPLLILILMIIRFKTIIKDSSLLILFVVTLISTIKSFYAANTVLYAAFGIPFLSISLCCIVLNFLPFQPKINKKHMENALAVLFIMLFLNFIIHDSISLINTQRGKILSYKLSEKVELLQNKNDADNINKEVKKIINLTKKDDIVIIMPEGHILNYLSNRRSDNFYHTYMPPYIEFFGENNIINHLNNHKPELIVLHGMNLYAYGHTHICKSYAKDLCAWVYKNYEFESIIGEGNYQFINYKKRK